MNSKLGNPMRFEFNKYAIAITGLFVLTLVLILALPPALSDLRLLPAGLETIVAGIVGWRASRMFGGRRNFIGRVLIFFCLAIFGYTIASALTALEDLQLLQPPALLSASGVSTWIGVLAGCFSAYALVASVRSLWDRYDHRTLLVVLFSLALALVVSSTNLLLRMQFSVRLLSRTPCCGWVLFPSWRSFSWLQRFCCCGSWGDGMLRET